MTRPRLCAQLAALPILSMALLAPVAVHAQTGAEARRIATEIHDREDYAGGLHFRREDGTLGSFPAGLGAGGEGEGGRGYDHGAGTEGFDERLESDERRGSPPSTFPSFHLPSFGGAWLTMLLQAVALLALLGLVVAIVVAILRRSSPHIPQPRPHPPPAPSGLSKEAPLPWDVGDPDQLFAAGRLADAILALLVRGLRRSGWSPETQRARTAREVCAALPAEDSRRAPLAALVRGAERVRFAGDPPSAELFHELSQHRDALEHADEPGGTA
ncbi:MAG: DUF4129 domain-containing protein [Deltaproteobacteria bacterium]|nr:DUF4129 domain-containing protein [Deltaproteobacteria bacterium]